MFKVYLAVFVIIFCLFIKLRKYIKNKHIEINKFFNELSELRKEYISYNTLLSFKDKYSQLRDSIGSLSSKMIKFIDTYDNLEKLIDKFNEEFIDSELHRDKKYFDELFEYPLDDEQRKAIVTNDDNNLIIAGAGSGKTTTIIGKTRYLIDKKYVNPKEIITISFTNATTENFKKMLDNKDVDCLTFHKLGKRIIEEGNSKCKVAPDGYLRTIINKYLDGVINNDPDKSEHFVDLYAYYMYSIKRDDLDFGNAIEIEKGYDLQTLKHKYYKAKKLETFQGETVKSVEELIIANFLFLNGIEYIYEDKYDYPNKGYYYYNNGPDFHLLDSDIYIEHFGINREGRAPQFTEIEEEKYLTGIKEKRKIHIKNGTKLIETYSYEINEPDFIKIFEKRLKKHGVVFKRRNNKEMVKVISRINNKEMDSFYSLIEKFIKLFKGNNYDVKKFDEFYNDSLNKYNLREMYLLELIEDIYSFYQKELHDNEYIDFDDMINLATDRVQHGFNKKISYIIIDEFQDVSFSRYRLIKTIQDKTGAKIVAVGDDWQSIYRFSGCDLNLFVNFEDYFSHPKIMYISNTYRNCQNLIDVASSFIMQNEKGQIYKELVSNKENIDKPIELYYYKDNIVYATQKAVDQLVENGCKKIAILGRNNKDIEKYSYKTDLIHKEVDMSKLFNHDVVFTTVHRSKGLEYDGVIICNMDNYIAGFPNKMSDDPILDYVTLTKDDYLFEEERRLFYVALTRTKTKCCLMVPIINPSCFVEEIEEFDENINKVIVQDDERLHNPKCPKCKKGILLVRKTKLNEDAFVGCSNYPKCDFKIKDISVIDHPIECPSCGSYMVKRKGIRGEFYGCNNYPHCTQTIEIDEADYYSLEKDDYDEKLYVKESIFDKFDGLDDFEEVEKNYCEYVCVVFPTSYKEYKYKVPKGEVLKKGDIVTIENQYGISDVTVTRGNFEDVEDSFYSELPIKKK